MSAPARDCMLGTRAGFGAELRALKWWGTAVRNFIFAALFAYFQYYNVNKLLSSASASV